MAHSRPDRDQVIQPGYMDMRHNLHQELRTAIPVWDIDSQYQQSLGRGGHPIVNRYRCDDADYVAVSMGSIANRTRDIIDELRNDGIKIGNLSLHLYRPFPNQTIISCLKDVKRVVVLEKALSYGNQGALFGDIKAALYPCLKRPDIHNYILGLGGRDVTNEDLYQALKESCSVTDKIEDTPRWIGLNR